MRNNILLNTDSYKASHYLQYPPGTVYVYSYIESRGGEYDATVMFGLQMFIKEYLKKPFTMEDINEAEAFWKLHGEPFDRKLWEYILDKYNGYLPLEIRAVPEGTVIKTHNVLATVVNTDPKCFWLTSFMETAILRAIWYPTTVATMSKFCKQQIMESLIKTCENPEEQILFKLHDFGARGASSKETAGIGGAAHLVNFMGSDTVEGVRYANHYYGGIEMAGFSIPAAEHSTITSWGKDNELAAFRNMIVQFAKKGSLVAVVSDSYDIYKATNQYWGEDLKKEVLESGATVVVRPDSGNPLTMPVEIVKLLDEKYGSTMNGYGYKVLHPSVRVIQGDGITPKTLPVILQNMMEAGYSTENIAFGMGAGLLQKCDRDTLKFAMKCSAIWIDGNDAWTPVYKEPVTDAGKKSKRGRFSVCADYTNGNYKTIDYCGDNYIDVMKVVYYNGAILVDETFEAIRSRSNNSRMAIRATS